MKSVAVEKQSYSLFLGGMKKEDLNLFVTSNETVLEFGRKMGITFVGYLIEYRLDETEDLKIVSLLVKPATEKRYICRCMSDKTKLPIHIYRGGTGCSLRHLTATCPCNLKFMDYFK